MKAIIIVLAVLGLGETDLWLSAADRTSSSYTIPRDTIDAGGGLSRGATSSYVTAGSLRSVGGLPALDSGAWTPSLPIYEPFRHPVGPLIGQTTPGGWSWLEAGTAGPEQPTVEAGALPYVGLAYAPSNRVELRAGIGPSAKLPFAEASVAIGGSGGPLNSGTLFFSFVLRVRDPSGLSADGDYFAALTPSPLNEPETPSEAFVRVLVRPTTGGYNVGVVKSSSDPADFLWDPRLWDTNVNVFLLGAYTFEPGTDDDVARVWVCPAGVSFCDTALAPTLLTSTAGPDAAALGSFVYFQRQAPKLPAVLWSDELRIGTAWLNVVEPGDDWGDAPSPPFPTLAADNGASHTVVPGFHLGKWIDLECDGNPGPGATGDDTSSLNDEDGLLSKNFARDAFSPFLVEASADGLLDAWIDLNHNGIWLDAGEQVFTNESLVAGLNNLSVNLPATATVGYTLARLRFSSTGGLAPTGHADDGEVEDHRVEIVTGLEPVVAAPVTDINPGPAASSARLLTAVGETVFLVADDGSHGTELWKCEGRPAETVLVRDIAPGEAFSNPAELTPVGSTLFFIADDGLHGRELWRSDGTEDGTGLVKDILPGVTSSGLAGLASVGTTLFFRANDGSTGHELWKSDGTEAGTVRVRDIKVGGPSSIPEFLTAVGNTLFFTADTSVYGEELWMSDGTEAGTMLVKDIKPGPDRSTPQLLTAVGNRLFFRAMDAVGSTDYELWVSDGSEAGTYRVKDIWPGLNASNPTDLTATDDTLYCIANDGEHGRELWKSDGTEAGTVMVKDIRLNLNTEAAYLTAVGPWLYFSANDGISGHELWTSDGTEAGTILVKDIWPGGSSSRPKFITAAGNRVFFSASDGIAGEELWTSDGLEAGTVLVGDVFPGSTGSWPSNLVAVGSTLLFTATDPNTGNELWNVIPTSAAEVDLQVALVPEDADAEAGYLFNLTTTVSNAGPSTATRVHILIGILLTGQPLEPALVTPSQGSCLISNDTVVCEVGSLAPGQTASVQIQLVPPGPGDLRFDASGSSDQEELIPQDNTISLVVPVDSFDYGDASDSHHTLRTSNGPRHPLRPGWSLGSLVDADPDGMPSGNADGDDVGDGTDDEDGIVFLTPLTTGLISKVEVAVTIPSRSNGFLNAWVDFNRNGRFSTGLEHALVDVPVTSGVSTQNFLVPLGVSSGPACARFRLSAVPGISFDGSTSRGEVEDYRVEFETPTEQIVWVRNPTSGIDLYCHIHRPVDFDPNHIYPGLMLVPGGIAPGTSFDTGYRAQRYADLGFIVMHFDAEARGLSTAGSSYTNEDCNGFLQQDGLRAVLQHLAALPETDDLNIGIHSSSYGITMASGMLARYPHNPGVKFLLDWEGPANRTHTLGGSIYHDPFDDPWWDEREASGFISHFLGYYLRVQTEEDHVQPDNDHAILLVNLATHTRHGGGGRCVWTRLNSATGVTTNDPNSTYLPDELPPPDYIAEGLPTEPLIEQYLLELAAMPPLAGPVRVIFDLHMDPMFSIPASNRLDVYHLRRDAANWALDQCDLRGVRVTFLAGGEFYEYILEDPGMGDALLQRAYDSGGSIGTHMHRESQAGPHNWSELSGDPPLSAIRTAWEDHIDLANLAIARALGLSTPAEIGAVNNIFGTHIPNDHDMRLDLLADYGFSMHEQGPDEEFFGYFQHHAMNPYRPASDHFLNHDPSGPVVLSPFGPVLGKSESHYGIAQDMRVPAVQARFLLELLNWLHDVHVAGSGRVWTMGWASHGCDVTPGQPTRAALPLMLDWLKNEFVDQIVGGYQAAAFSSAAECRDLYQAWETVHPGEPSFAYPASTTDWTHYPYLRAPAAYLVDAHYQSPMLPVGSVRWHALTAAPASASPFTVYVAYSADGLPVTVDLSAHLAMPTIAAVDTDTGAASVVPASAVPVPPKGVILVPPGRVLTLRFDLGDADAGYPVLLADDGARHDASSLRFGIEWDAELDGQPSPMADRDDLTGLVDDEDGVLLPPNFVPGTSATVTVQVTGGPGVVDAWIDWNRDRAWNDFEEHVLAATPVSSGVSTLPISVPASAVLGPTAARFRLSTAGSPLPTGYAANGEVEDYQMLLTTDQTPPVLACPDRVIHRATDRSGLVVTYTVTATDNDDPAPMVICTPPSGSVFPLGTTWVNCTATDASDNTAHCAFPVEVKELEANSSPSGLTLYWDIPGAVLEEANSLHGPWTTVTEARSPLTVPLIASTKFYRLRHGTVLRPCVIPNPQSPTRVPPAR